ncbi:MAG: FimB/Mfa2 family fimbrial subunit, partial [Tannerellaceae bacterium]|nr:FimB/Mfa2 family fimbrial subunit [Tannerellaceae bacterium]
MTKQTYLIIWILLGAWLVSCQDYIDIRNTPSVVDGNKIEVTIATNVPAITVQTRGVKATTEENRLDAVDILVFEQQGEEKVFAYRRKNTNDLSDFEEDEKVYVKTQLDISENGEKYLIVLIANLRSELDALFGGNNEKEEDYAGVSKEELLERITFKQNGLWAASQENFRPLPMWGETTTAVEIQTNTTFDPIDLIRSVARIELGVYISDEKMDVGNGKNLFDIKEVKVYNVREQGRATPDPDYIIEKDNEKQVT